MMRVRVSGYKVLTMSLGFLLTDDNKLTFRQIFVCSLGVKQFSCCGVFPQKLTGLSLSLPSFVSLSSLRVGLWLPASFRLGRGDVL